MRRLKYSKDQSNDRARVSNASHMYAPHSDGLGHQRVRYTHMHQYIFMFQSVAQTWYDVGREV